MSLMNSAGPFGHAPAGVFNAEVPREELLYFEPSPRRMRGLFAGETVVDSRRVKLLYERNRPPGCDCFRPEPELYHPAPCPENCRPGS